MKKSLAGVGLFLLIFGLTGVAGAVTYTDYYDAENEELTMFESVSWTFDITDDGYNPKTQQITSASITLFLKDDERDFSICGLEVAYLNVGGELHFAWEVDTGTEKFIISGIITLSATGKLNVTLMSLWGDFILVGAQLDAEGTAPVPEPSTVMLFGSGLLVFGIWRKTRKRKVLLPY